MNSLAKLARLGICLVVATELAAGAPLGAQHETHSGTGDSVVRLSKPDSSLPALLVVQGNAEERHFAIVGYTSSQDMTDAFVNTTERYLGIVPVDLPPNSSTAMLEISASGQWEIQVHPIGAAQRIQAPGNFDGTGDNVLLIQGEPMMAKVTGNQASRHFAILAFDGRGRLLDAMVNTTDRYDGTVMVPKGALLLQVSARGSWRIELQ